MIKLRRQIISLLRQQDGVAAVEFALIAPALILVLFGAFDVGHSIYMRSVLDGAVQKAARDSSLETGPEQTTVIDEQVARTVKNLSVNAQVEFSRESYFNFNDVDRAELYTDTNRDGECNNDEVFEDENDNGVWDEDVGEQGIGGPKDIVKYTVRISYPALFSFNMIEKNNGLRTLVSTTVLKNQPYGQQDAEATSTPGTCSEV